MMFLFQSPMLLLPLFLVSVQKNTVLIVFFSSSDPVHYQMAVVVIRIGCHFCSILRKQMPPQQQLKQHHQYKKASTKFGLNLTSYVSSRRNKIEAVKQTHCACTDRVREGTSMVEKIQMNITFKVNGYALQYNQCASAF